MAHFKAFFSLLVLSVTLSAFEGEELYELDSSAFSIRVETGYTGTSIIVEGDTPFIVGNDIVYEQMNITAEVYDATLGVTYFIDRFAFDIYVKSPFKVIENRSDDGSTTRDYNKLEYNGVISYQVFDQYGVFLGYRISNLNTKNAGPQSEDIVYNTKGATFGIYGGSGTKTHIFNYSIGYVKQVVEYKLSGFFPSSLNGGPVVQTAKGKNDGSGVNVTLSYRYIINNFFDIGVKLPIYVYSNGTVNFDSGAEGELGEQRFSLAAVVTYTF